MSEGGRIGSLIAGKWQIDARIGSGGMATVYSATHRNGHRAAIKVLHAQLSRDPGTRARFQREAYVANSVEHPGVVPILDDGMTDDGCAFLILELLEGETVDARRLRFGGRLPVNEALDIGEQTLDVLVVAHEKDIVHRDIKPENVFWTKEGQIKLLDFGLARMKAAGGDSTKTGVTLGTPEFMPPEQAMGRKDSVDARTDVWAIGATLFTCITGRFVHEDARSVHEQLIASATRRSPPVRQFAKHITNAVGDVIDRALELEPADRWGSASEMLAALRAARAERVDDEDMQETLYQKPKSSPRKVAAAPPAAVPTPVPTTRMRGSPIDPRHASGGNPRAMLPEEFDGETMMAPASAIPSRPSTRPILEQEEKATSFAPIGPSFSNAPTPMVPMYPPHQGWARPNAPTVPGQRQTQERSATQMLIAVSIILIVVAAAMGAYVLGRGSTPPPMP